MYDLEMGRVAQEIVKRRARRVLLQLPDGLKPKGFDLARGIEKRTGALVMLSSSHCFGSCDLATDEAKALGADVIVHYGHSPWEYDAGVRVIYVEARSDLNVEKSLTRALLRLKDAERIGLVAPLQFVAKLEIACSLLRGMGKEGIIGGKGDGLAYKGQITGCNYSSAIRMIDSVDAFIVIGGGTFHALGLALTSGKKTIVADPHSRRAYEVDHLRKRILMQRWALISRFDDHESFGILVGIKPGQRHLKEAKEIKKEMERHGRRSLIIPISDLEDHTLQSFSDIDAFIDTACPRVAIDDLSKFSKPILLPAEIEVALKKTQWDVNHPLRISPHFWLRL